MGLVWDWDRSLFNRKKSNKTENRVFMKNLKKASFYISKPTFSRKREIEIFIMAFDRYSRFAKRCSWGALGAQGPLGALGPPGVHPMVPIGPR